jgi:hypothetical protein
VRRAAAPRVRLRNTTADYWAQLVREARQPDAPDVCLHFGVNWRALAPESDGRLHATCGCGAHVSRSAFVEGGAR